MIFLIVLGVCSMLGGGGRGCMGRLFGGLGMRLVCVLRGGVGWVEVKGGLGRDVGVVAAVVDCWWQVRERIIRERENA